jgi:hypothetical protein
MSRAALMVMALMALGCADATQPSSEQLSESAPQPALADQALLFDGVDDYASTGTARMPQIERPQTLALWCKPSSSGGAQLQVLFTLRRSDWSGIALALEAGTPLAFNVFARRDLARAEQPLSFDEWHHLAYVVRGAESLLYVDGALAGTGAGPQTNRTPLLSFIGSLDGYDAMYRGALDELRVYDRAFTEQEVAALAAGQRFEAEPLVLYLPFDEAAGARSYDRSGLGNHAELGDGVAQLMPERVASGAPRQ